MNTPANIITPFSEADEQATLGAILINPECYHGIAALLKADDFFLVRHRYIFEAIAKLTDHNTPIDYLTLRGALKDNGRLDEIGGEAYLTLLVNNTPTSLYGEVYARQVAEKSTRRRMLVAADTVRRLALDQKQELSVVQTEALSTLESAVQVDSTASVTTIGGALQTVLNSIENDTEMALPTGFTDLDDLIKGQGRGLFIVLAGRPGMGKTSWLLGDAMNAARMGKRVAFFTMEMSTEEITRRALAMEAGISALKFKPPYNQSITPAELSRIYEAAGRMADWKIFFDSTSGSELTPTLLRAKCRRLIGRCGLDLVIVDYAQMMNGSGKARNTREQEVAYISRSLKNLARDLNVPVVSAASLNRDVDSRPDKRPILSDLRDSGALEFDADIVMFLYRDVVYNEATEFPNQAEVIVAKNRNGATGTITLHFEKSLTKFQNGTVRHVDLNADFVPTKTPRTTYVNPFAAPKQERRHDD